MKILGESPKNGTLSVLFTYMYIFYFDIFVSLDMPEWVLSSSFYTTTWEISAIWLV